MKTIANVVSYWLLKGRDASGEDFASWCLLSSLMLVIMSGFVLLTWHFPIVGLFIFCIIFMPILIQLYLKFNDKVINARIEELRALIEKTNKLRRYY